MSIAFGAAGAVAYGTTSVAPAYPAGIAAGQLLLVKIGTRPGNTVTATLPSGGWWRVGESIGTFGTTGLDAGPTRAVVFAKIATGSESGTLSITVTSGDACFAYMESWTCAAGARFSLELFTGQDSSSGTGYSAAATAYAGALVTGDFLSALIVKPTDAGSTAAWSAHGFTATGITFSARTEVAEAATANGNDLGGVGFYASVSSGTMSGTSITATATLSNASYGPAAIVRIREITPGVMPKVTGMTSDGFDGNGTLNLPLPDGTFWTAQILVESGATITAPSGWELKQSLGGGVANLYASTSSTPGTGWVISGNGTNPASGILNGYVASGAISMNTPTLGTSGTFVAPSITASANSLVGRVLFGAQSTATAIGYPAAAINGRNQYTNTYAAGPENHFTAIALEERASAGSTGTATFTGGTLLGSDTLTFQLTATNPPSTPTGLDVTAGVREVGVSFGSVAGADSYQIRWRRTDLTPPSTTTQSSPPWHLGMIADGVSGGNFPYTYNGDGVIVFVLDTGLRPTHNEFSSRVEGGSSFVATAWNVSVISHGTWVTSNAIGTTYGVAKGADTYHIKILPDDAVPGQSPNYSTFSDWVDLMISIAAGRPGVANFSLPVPGVSSPDYAEFSAGLDALEAANITCVAAIGNSNVDISSDLGAAHNKMILVGGTTSTNAFWVTTPGTEGSSWYSGMQLVAPADNVTGADDDSDSDTQSGSGTSFASPITAGIVALIKQANPKISTTRIKEMLYQQGWNVVTSQPSGLDLRLVNSGTQSTEWTIASAPSTSFDFEGLPENATIEVQVRAEDGGLYSAWSSSDSAITTGDIVDVSAPFAGSGSLTSTQFPSHDVNASFTGSGTLSAALEFVVDVSAPLNGSGSLTTVTEPVYDATAPLTGSGTLTAVVASEEVAVLEAFFDGSGTLTATTEAVVDVAATLTGSGTLSAASFPSHDVNAPLSGAGTLSASTEFAVDVSATFTGSGTLTAVTEAVYDVSAPLSGSGTLSATQNALYDVQASLSGSGSLTAPADATYDVSATLNGSGDLTAASEQVYDTSIPLSGSGTLTAVVQTADQAQVEVFFSGEGTLSGTADAVYDVSASFNSTGTLTAPAEAVYDVPATLSGSGFLVADSFPSHDVSANFSGAGTLTAIFDATVDVSAPFTGSGTLTAVLDSGSAVETGAVFSGSGALMTEASPVYEIVAGFSGAGALSLTTAPFVIIDTVASFTGAGSLEAVVYKIDLESTLFLGDVPVTVALGDIRVTLAVG